MTDRHCMNLLKESNQNKLKMSQNEEEKSKNKEKTTKYEEIRLSENLGERGSKRVQLLGKITRTIVRAIMP